MSAPRHRPWSHGPESRGYGGGNPGLRVSDAERAEVADRLSKHYSDGRLDQATFDERLDQAMRAKTQADLAGLFADLPEDGPPGALPGAGAAGQAPPGRYRHRRGHRLLFLILVAVAAIAVGSTAHWSFIPWLMLGILAFLWLRYGPRQRSRS
jgi:DUF1707 SHOCT-like domain